MSRKKSGLSPSSCVYTSCYCEENVWKLCERLQKEGNDLDPYYVVFISNAAQKVPLWMQRKSKDPLTPIVWDYHVILIKADSTTVLVYDLDCVLHFPCPLDIYVAHAIQKEDKLRREYHRKFRILSAQCFLDTFASDRSHMKQADGSWSAPPPSYPPIRTTDCVMNLDSFISMDEDEGEGQVEDLDSLVAFFNSLK